MSSRSSTRNRCATHTRSGSIRRRSRGRTETNLHFKLPLLHDLKFDQVEYGVKARSDGRRDSRGRDGSRPHRRRFRARNRPAPGVHLQGNARFDGVPINIDGSLVFKPKDGPRARYRVALTLDDEQRRRLGLRFLPDRLAGPVGVDLTY